MTNSSKIPMISNANSAKAMTNSTKYEYNASTPPATGGNNKTKRRQRNQRGGNEGYANLNDSVMKQIAASDRLAAALNTDAPKLAGGNSGYKHISEMYSNANFNINNKKLHGGNNAPVVINPTLNMTDLSFTPKNPGVATANDFLANESVYAPSALTKNTNYGQVMDATISPFSFGQLGKAPLQPFSSSVSSGIANISGGAKRRYRRRPAAAKKPSDKKPTDRKPSAKKPASKKRLVRKA
jgi:hypothetical protein